MAGVIKPRKRTVKTIDRRRRTCVTVFLGLPCNPKVYSLLICVSFSRGNPHLTVPRKTLVTEKAAVLSAFVSFLCFVLKEGMTE
ncbi:hypothetical protein CLU79DRAFT_765309 [Phycomyces nitens]|nr:hypothetical protein CLU79DRAFT_765309 [Phycomyces nitens]